MGNKKEQEDGLTDIQGGNSSGIKEESFEDNPIDNPEEPSNKKPKRKRSKEEKILVGVPLAGLYLAALLSSFVLPLRFISMILMIIFTVLFIWNLQLDDKKTTTIILSSFVVNPILFFIGSLVYEAAHTGNWQDLPFRIFTIFISFGGMIGGGILIAFLATRKMRKNPTEEERIKAEKQANGIAYRNIIYTNLAVLFGKLSLISIGTFLVGFGTMFFLEDAQGVVFKETPYFVLNKGFFFAPLAMFYVIIFGVFGIAGAISIQRLNILYNMLKLDTTRFSQMEAEAQTHRMRNTVYDAANIKYAEIGDLPNKAEGICEAHLRANGIKAPNQKIYRIITIPLGLLHVGGMVLIVVFSLI